MLRATFTQLGAESREATDLATNWALLRDLAGAAGGEVYTPETADQLAQRLRQEQITHTDRYETKLWRVYEEETSRWQWPALVLWFVVIGLFTAEWAGRKLAGLP
jgi:hypothetical protein